MNKITVNKFDGGTTDSYLNAPSNCSYLLDNFSLDENGTPSTRNGFFCFPERIPTSIGSTRVSGVYLGGEPFGLGLVMRAEKAYFRNASDSWTEILGPTSNSAIPNKSYSDIEDAEIWRGQLLYTSGPSTVLPHRIYCTDDSPLSFRALTLGLPDVDDTITAGSAGGSGNNYIYAFHYFLQFTDYQGTLFEEKGPVITLSVTNVGTPDSNTITLSNIPVLANTSSTNYDTSTALKVRISRTTSNGSVFYFVKDVANGTTSTTDTSSDSTIQSAEVLYISGGALEYTQPPVGARYIAQVNDFFWYATERSLFQSIQGAPGACPAEYEQPTDQKIRGLSNVIGFPILFCDRSVYRVDGTYDEFGDGGFQLLEISKTAGCVSNKSIVAINEGLLWAGNNGFYFTDGYQVRKISKGLETRYKIWKDGEIAGTYDQQNNLVIWTVSSSQNSITAPNDQLVVLHLNFGLTDSSVFTTYSFDGNVFPTAVAYSQSVDVDDTFRSKLLVADNRGYLLYQDPLAYADPLINTELYPSEFKQKVILWRYESCGLDFGDDSVRKWCTELTAELRNETELAVQFLTRRDDGGPWATLSEIRRDGAILWDITEYPWDGDEDTATPPVYHDWNSQSVIDGRRHFPKNTLRSNRRQIGLTNALTYIAKSDDLGLATTDATFNWVTLNNTAEKWPDDCEGYQVGFDSDDDGVYDYFTIVERVSDTRVRVADPYNLLPSGSALLWQLRGHRKFERAYLLSYTVWFADEGATQQPSRGSAGLVNA